MSCLKDARYWRFLSWYSISTALITIISIELAPSSARKYFYQDNSDLGTLWGVKCNWGGRHLQRQKNMSWKRSRKIHLVRRGFERVLWRNWRLSSSGCESGEPLLAEAAESRLTTTFHGPIPLHQPRDSYGNVVNITVCVKLDSHGHVRKCKFEAKRTRTNF